MQITIYFLSLLTAFLFLLFAGLNNNQKEKYYGLLAGFFILLMLGIIGLSSPIQYNTGVETNYTNSNQTGHPVVYTVENKLFNTQPSTMEYILNIVFVLIGVGGLYTTWFFDKELQWEK
jgi:hypothetical protein